jgi:uncharacterized SAM-binding protein YcdF (DUF218 family)
VIRRFLGGLVTLWAFGFLWFALFLPQPAAPAPSDAVIVPTGGAGRIERGLELLRLKQSAHLLVSGVDPEVKPGEFAAEYKVSRQTMDCCVTLDFAAVDTRSNASESAAWVAAGKYKRLRLVTTDWHMRRAAFELGRALPGDVEVVEDAVRSKPSFDTLFLEYHKLIAAMLASLWRG